MAKLMQSGQIANYNDTAPTFEDGEPGSLQLDPRGNLKSTLATGLRYEDDEVAAFDDVYNYEVIKTATTTTIKTGSGFIKEIRVLGGTLGDVSVFDDTTGTTNEIVPAVTPTAGMVLKKSCAFSTGLTIVTAAATIVVVSYR